MKLKLTFETVEMGDEIIAVPVADSANVLHGVLKLNKEGAEILEQLKDNTTEENIVKSLGGKYENDHESLAECVHTFIETLRNNGLIED